MQFMNLYANSGIKIIKLLMLFDKLIVGYTGDVSSFYI